MKKYLLILIIAALTLLISAGAALAQEPDPLTVLEAYDLALQAKDVEGALSLFADDAVLTTRTGQLVGKEEIRTWLERLVTQNERIEVASREIVEGKVTWQNKFFRADLSSLSNDPLEAETEATIEAGKIKTFSSILTDDSQAKLDAAVAAQPAPETAAPASESATPAQLPSTGGNYAMNFWLSVALIGVGAFLLGAGSLVKWL